MHRQESNTRTLQLMRARELENCTSPTESAVSVSKNASSENWLYFEIKMKTQLQTKATAI